MRRWTTIRSGILLSAALLVAAIGATTRESVAANRFASSCGNAALTWEPHAPRQGALFRVHVTGVARASHLSATLAGEQLHFIYIDGDSSQAQAFAAIPIDGDRSLGLVLRCADATGSDSLVATISASSANYPIDRLKVAPRFGTPPDSATAERIRRESERAQQVARNAHLTPRLWSESFVQPREARITSGFGHGREFNGTITSRHMGTDFAGTVGAPVRAMNRGVVRIVDAFYYGGNVVYVDHGNGLTSAYLHLSKQDVAVGDTVTRGQVIGRVGATGRVTGPHLHLIVRYGSITVDPMSLFAIAGSVSR